MGKEGSGEVEYSSVAVAWTCEDRCHGCPKLGDHRFTTVRFRKGWQRICSSRKNGTETETLVVGEVKFFKPKDSKWKQIVKKLKHYWGMVTLRDEYAQKFEGNTRSVGNVCRATATVWPLKAKTKTAGSPTTSAPQILIWQRRGLGLVPSLDIPKVRPLRSENNHLSVM